MKLINSFRDEFFFLSNFFPVIIWNAGIRYPSAEHAYQAAKTLDMGMRRKIAAIPRPGQAKRAGRNVVLREDWDTVKLDVMRRILEMKFSVPSLRAKLLATGDARLVEGNTWGDRFWGEYAGRGANHLGRLLMETREKINKP